MKSLKYLLILVVTVVFVQVEGSSPSDPTYKVGVVEFHRSKGKNANEKLEENLMNAGNLFRNYLSNGTPGSNIDVVIFPESVLNTVENPVEVPDPKTKPKLCDPSAEGTNLLSELSCWAGKFRKYMVFNLVEKTECTAETQKQQNDKRPCGKDGLTRYNTNVVFDRNGSLIARYRKVNPYHEFLINTTMQSEYTTFDTDFGVKFGTAICFDILFKTPTQELVEKHKITDILYPTYWFSELPFLSANQIQQAWSYANNVNLLAAGGNTRETGTTGSGIFAGRSGALVAKMYGQDKSEMLIAEVPKLSHKTLEENEEAYAINIIPPRIRGLKINRDENLEKFSFTKINKTGNISETLCHGDICCKFDLNVLTFDKFDDHKHYKYRMVAYSGLRDFFNGYRTLKFKVCAIVACIDDENDLKSCGKVFDDDTKVQNVYYFNKIEIEGKTKKFEDVLFMPNSVNQLLSPLPVSAFKFNVKEESGSKIIRMNTTNDNSDLLTFGILAFDYKSSGVMMQFSSLILFGVALVRFFM